MFSACNDGNCRKPAYEHRHTCLKLVHSMDEISRISLSLYSSLLFAISDLAER